MDDKEFILALLADYGREVAQSTAELIRNELSTMGYIADTREQFQRYGLALLEWKNGPTSNSEDPGRDSEEPPVF